MIIVSMKKMIITLSLLCAVNAHALSPEMVAASVAAAPVVAGALHSTYLYNFAPGGHSPFNINEIQNDKDVQYTPAEAMGTYIGSFILGAIPGVNLIVYSCDMKTWGKDTIDAAGLKAGMATDLSVPLAIVLYFAFLRR
jgi:hypothetical protein